MFTFGDPVAEPLAAASSSAGAAGAGAAPANMPAAEGGSGTPECAAAVADGFGATCTSDADCTCRANYCALMPGQTQGVCTVQGCKETPSVCPADYSCFDLSIFGSGLPSICTKS